MKQRLCLGRSMIHDPSVLILDEPAAGLDPRARIELREMIRQLASDGKTILVSSHILTELSEICDRVGIIEQGRLLATGTVQEILRRHTPHSEVRVQVLGDGAGLERWLQQRPAVQNIAVDGERVRFTHEGGRDEQAEFLKQMVLAGFRIAEFAAHQQSLEDVFMRVTRGAVQ
jgi:ABC-2 type transport system ATP-binding protein